MAKMSASEVAEKWSRNTKGATEEMRRGVQRVTEAPGAKAAAKADKMRAGIVESIDSGKWADNVAAVPLSEWKEKMLTKGVGRVSAGVDAANGKVVDFHNQLSDHQDRLSSQIENMPDLTLEDGINRMVAQVRGMSEFSFKR